MRDKILRKALVVGIILLFIGLSVTSSISGNIGQKSNQSTEEVATSFPLNDGLLAYWKSDECNGTTLWDCSSHNYNGTIYGATWTPGCCLVFDGVDDYVDFDNHSENLGYNKTDDYTISVWFKSTSSKTGTIYGMSHTDTDRAFAYLDLNANGSLSYKTGDETCELAVYSAADTYNDGTWHYVEVKFLGDPVNPTLEIYVDDILEGSITGWLCPYLSEDFKKAKMGRRSTTTTNYFDGIIDEVKIYKYPGGTQPPLPPLMWTEDFSTLNILIVDPDGDDIWIFIDWGDGHGEWMGPFESGEIITFNVWPDEGTYQFKLKARDWGGESPEAVYILTLSSDFKFFHVSLGYVDIIYKFTIYLEDYENYLFDWGDGTYSDWVAGIADKSFSYPGEYELRWKAKDKYGFETPWSDPILITILTLGNNPPYAPTIDGPTSGKPGEELCWTFHTADPDGDDIMYIINWGDGESNTTDCYPSCTEVEVCHTYYKKGIYIITAMAKECPDGLVSPTATLTVTVPRNKATYNTLFFRFLERFPLLERLLKLI